MTETDDVIANMQAAGRRISDRGHKNRADWFIVGEGFERGRSECLAASLTNSVHDPRFKKCFKTWLDATDMRKFIKESCWLFKIMPHKHEILAWLEINDRGSCINYPQTIWNHWANATGQQRRCKRMIEPRCAPIGRPKKGHTPRRPDQSLIRIFWSALRESGSGDYLVLAAVAAQLHVDLTGEPDRPRPLALPAPGALPAALHAPA